MAIWRRTTKGEMLSGWRSQGGVAGYVAIEMVTGTLAGKHGSFALQHFSDDGPEWAEDERASSCPDRGRAS